MAFPTHLYSIDSTIGTYSVMQCTSIDIVSNYSIRQRNSIDTAVTYSVRQCKI